MSEIRKHLHCYMHKEQMPNMSKHEALECLHVDSKSLIDPKQFLSTVDKLLCLAVPWDSLSRV